MLPNKQVNTIFVNFGFKGSKVDKILVYGFACAQSLFL